MALTLRGLRVVVTRAVGQAHELAEALAAVGAEVMLRPLIRIDGVEDRAPLLRAVAGIGGYDWVIFTSANAVNRFVEELNNTGVACTGLDVRVAAVGRATAAALNACGIRVDVVPTDYVAHAIAGELAATRDLTGARVLWPKAQGSDVMLAELLGRQGAQVDAIETYRTEPDEEAGAALRAEVVRGGVDVLTFASPSAVRAFGGAIVQIGRTRVAVIGPVTGEEARRRGLPVDIESQDHTAASLALAICDYFGALARGSAAGR